MACNLPMSKYDGKHFSIYPKKLNALYALFPLVFFVSLHRFEEKFLGLLPSVIMGAIPILLILIAIWFLFGEERINSFNDEVSIDCRIFQIPFFKEIHIKKIDIKSVEIAQKKTTIRGSIRYDRLIAFNCSGGVRYSLVPLDESQAIHALEFLIKEGSRLGPDAVRPDTRTPDQSHL